MIPEGRGVRVRISEERIKMAVEMAEKVHEEGDSDEVTEDEEDVDPAFILTTHNMYSVLGKEMKLVSLSQNFGVGNCFEHTRLIWMVMVR